MKLTSAEIERTLSQFEAQAIPDDHPVVPQLNSLFGGEHTFCGWAAPSGNQHHSLAFLYLESVGGPNESLCRTAERSERDRVLVGCCGCEYCCDLRPCCTVISDILGGNEGCLAQRSPRIFLFTPGRY